MCNLPGHRVILASALLALLSQGTQCLADGEHCLVGSLVGPTAVPLPPVDSSTTLTGFYAADMNGDGRPDLIAVDTRSVRISLNLGSGRFGDPASVANGGSSSAAGDFNGDGVSDIALARGGTLVLLLGDGKGGSKELPPVAVNGSLSSLVVGDFNGDGRLDVAGLLSGQPAVFLGDGRGNLAVPLLSAVVPNPFDSVSITAAELTGDRSTDLILTTGGLNSGTASVLVSKGDGTFIRGATLASGYRTSMIPICVDLDQDSRIDVVLFESFEGLGGTFHVFLGDGAGGFVEKPVTAGTSVYTSNLSNFVSGDFTNDGKPDLVYGDGSSIVILTGGGDGSLGPEARITVNTRPRFLVVADFDGDGKADVVLGPTTDSGAILFTNGCPFPGSKRTLAIPVLLSTPGAAGSFWRSDLTITNSGTTTAHVELRYTATAGGGNGAVTTTLAPGSQISSPSAFDLLTSLGLDLPPADRRVGTLLARFSGLSSPHAAGISVRTTFGGAGVAYPGREPPQLVGLPPDREIVSGLRQDARDRSNLAFMRPEDPGGTFEDRTLHLSITLVSTDPSAPGSIRLPDLPLGPGEFVQMDRVLATPGLGATSGFAVVEPVGLLDTTIPYLVWGVVNDETGTSDGSLLPGRRVGVDQTWALPSVVESLAFDTEVVLTNTSTNLCPVFLLYHSSDLDRNSAAYMSTFVVPALGEVRWTDIVDAFRREDPQSVGPRGRTFAGTVEIQSFFCASVLFASSRVLGSKQRYGVAPPAIANPTDSGFFRHAAWVPDLRQDDAVRSNLVLVNVDWQPAGYLVELFDANGRKVAAREVQTSTSGWLQINSILADWAPGTARGWARVTQVTARNYTDFAAYAVLNDGASPGLGTGDGSIVWMEPEP